MKIKKAIDKAKLSRQHTMLSDKPFQDISGMSSVKAPVYSESRCVVPDKDILEKNRCVSMFSDSPYLGSYKLLRTQIQKSVLDKNWKTLMVTSAHPGEGKTLTAINLSLTFARAFDLTVLLIDCDLHRQDVHKYMGIKSDLGLMDYLMHDVPLKDLIIWPSIDKMTLISGGRTVQETTEILTSPRMRSMVDEVKNRYQDRYIIFDVPPVLMGADVIAFASFVDCIIMVVEAGKTSMEDINKALDLIPKEKFLGFVLNKDNTPNENSYYY
jgi:non-specific protein-tyrosine kinase